MIETMGFISDMIGVIMGAAFGIIVIVALIRTLLKTAKGESVSVPSIGVMNDLPGSITGVNKHNDMSERSNERAGKKTE